MAHAGWRVRKLILAAHADELCYLVHAIAPGGFLYLANGQAWERKTSLRNWLGGRRRKSPRDPWNDRNRKNRW